MGLDTHSDRRLSRLVAELLIVLVGVALLASAAAADAAWFDAHFLPDYFKPQAPRRHVAQVWRVVTVAIGLALILLLRPRVGRAVVARSGPVVFGTALRIFLAVLLALLSSELMLHTRYFQARHQTDAGREPLQQKDPHLGWVLTPGRVGYRQIGGRRIEYAVDAQGQRVRCAGCVVDPARPTLLFTGESIMLGTGLSWSESLPGQVESLLHIQSVNLAVNGYSSDQGYLRVQQELPRFSEPVAIVSLFMSSLFSRNLDDDRPHLDAALRWLPARQPWRLEAIADRLLPYHSDAAIERGVAMTRAVLRATVALARSRQAQALILIPVFVPETAAEQALRQRIFDGSGVPCLRVELDPAWRLRGDDHPDAHAAQVMAQAVAAQLSGGVPASGS